MDGRTWSEGDRHLALRCHRRARPDRPPLELDHRAILNTTKAQVMPYLADAAIVADWFGVGHCAEGEDAVSLHLPGVEATLSGTTQWSPDGDALMFHGTRPPLEAFLSVQTLILPLGHFGTEVRIHVEVPDQRPGVRLLAIIDRVTSRGLTRIQAELGT